MEFEEWANVTTSMVSMFIKQSHIISLKREIKPPEKRNMDNLRIEAKCAQQIQPIDPTGLFLVDDKDCPDVGGQGGNKDG